MHKVRCSGYVTYVLYLVLGAQAGKYICCHSIQYHLINHLFFAFYIAHPWLGTSYLGSAPTEARMQIHQHTIDHTDTSDLRRGRNTYNSENSSKDIRQNAWAQWIKIVSNTQRGCMLTMSSGFADEFGWSSLWAIFFGERVMLKHC